jgi:hypothetical protein
MEEVWKKHAILLGMYGRRIEDVYKKRIMHVHIKIIANCPDDSNYK